MVLYNNSTSTSSSSSNSASHEYTWNDAGALEKGSGEGNGDGGKVGGGNGGGGKGERKEYVPRIIHQVFHNWKDWGNETLPEDWEKVREGCERVNAGWDVKVCWYSFVCFERSGVVEKMEEI